MMSEASLGSFLELPPFCSSLAHWLICFEDATGGGTWLGKMLSSPGSAQAGGFIPFALCTEFK